MDNHIEERKMPKFPRVSSARSSCTSRYILREYGRYLRCLGHLLWPTFWLASLRKIGCLVFMWPEQMPAMISSMFGRYSAPWQFRPTCGSSC